MATNTELIGRIVRVEKSGSRGYKATDNFGNDITKSLKSYQLNKAYKNKSALKAIKSGKSIRWIAVSPLEFTDSLQTNLNMKKTEKVMDQKEFIKVITNAPSLRPTDYKMSDLHWKFSVRALLRGKNIMIVGPQGSGKTVLALTLAKIFDRPLFNIPLGSTQDPRSVLIGNTHFKAGTGTFVAESYFINAIKTKNAVILLDELSRAHPDAWNILMPVLDYKQRFLRIDEAPETPTIEVAEGVTFIATANIGHQFTATRQLDAALTDRFTVVEVQTLDKESESDLIKIRYPNIDSEIVNIITSIASDVRKDARSAEPRVSNIISTRVALEMAELCYDGFSIIEAAETAIYPIFSDAGGADSERAYIRQIVQKYLPNDADNTNAPFGVNPDPATFPFWSTNPKQP